MATPEDHDKLYGGPGNDSLHGQNGDDWIEGGEGDDLIRGFWGDDVLNGDDGHDNIEGHDGDDTLNGGAGNDLLDGGGHADFIRGGSGNDKLIGWYGPDILLGGTGTDVINDSYGANVKFEDSSGDSALSAVLINNNTIAIKNDSGGYQLYSAEGWNQAADAFVAKGAVSMRSDSGAVLETQIADLGFRLPTVGGTGTNRLHIPVEKAPGLKVPSSVDTTLAQYGITNLSMTGAGVAFKSGSEIFTMLDGAAPVDTGSTYLVISNQIDGTANFGETKLKSKSGQPVTFSIVVAPGTDFVFARISINKVATVGFGLSQSDQLVFNSSSQSKHYQEKVRGDLFVQVTDLAIPGTNGHVSAGGWALLDFGDSAGVGMSSDFVQQIISGADVEKTAEAIAGKIVDVLDDVERVAIAGTVRVGTGNLSDIVNWSYEAGAASLIVDTSANEIYSRLEQKGAPNPLSDTKIGNLFSIGDKLVVDSKINYSDIGQSEIYVGAYGGTFSAELDFDKHLQVQGHKSLLGNRFFFQGTVSFDGAVDLKASLRTHASTGFVGVNVGFAQTWNVGLNIDATDGGAIQFSMKASIRINGTVSGWLGDKYGLAGWASLDTYLNIKDLSTFDVGGFEANVRGGATGYFGWWSASVSAGIGIRVGDGGGVTIRLPGIASLSF